MKCEPSLWRKLLLLSPDDVNLKRVSFKIHIRSGEGKEGGSESRVESEAALLNIQQASTRSLGAKGAFFAVDRFADNIRLAFQNTEGPYREYVPRCNLSRYSKQEEDIRRIEKESDENLIQKTRERGDYECINVLIFLLKCFPCTKSKRNRRNQVLITSKSSTLFL